MNSPAIDSNRMLSRLEQLVSIETPTGDTEQIARAFALLRSWIEPVIGFAGTIETVDGVEHLSWQGGERPRVLLLGHVDTVWPLGTLAQRPFTLDGDRATGPGVFDMKAGLVIMAEALERAAHAGGVSILITSDEEVGSTTSRALVERMATRADSVLVLEPSLGGALKVARRGGSIYRITFHGKGAHAGLDPEKGHNALVELARQVIALQPLASADLGTTVSATVAQAGTVQNVIPDHAELSIDVRAWSVDELRRIDTAINSLSPHDAKVRIEVDGGINRPPMEKTLSSGLFDLAVSAAAAARLAPVSGVAVGGASDGNFTAALGVPTLDGLGPDGGGAHAVDEWISTSSFEQRAPLIAGLIDAIHDA